MAKKHEPHFHSVDVEFPDKAYAVYIIAEDGERNPKVYPLTPIFYTLEEVAFYIRESEEHFLESEDYSIQESALLLPLHLEKLWPLKEEYWHAPSQHYDGLDRIRLFMEVPKQYQLYKLLVTPSGIDEEHNVFLDAALPILASASASDKLLEEFLNRSDYPVLETAKNAALYSFGIPFRFNWQTGKVSIESTIPQHRSEQLN